MWEYLGDLAVELDSRGRRPSIVLDAEGRCRSPSTALNVAAIGLRDRHSCRFASWNLYKRPRSNGIQWVCVRSTQL